ncbi:hypothetical protein GOV03_04465 [Candidatus Woesearchaeota archaeon]|nr:hypothetical protein [Candidatus Woesearchaeota archaeon]
MKLIQQVMKAKESLGELSDLVLSAFLRESGFSENGFKFMAIEDNELTFAVPPQDDAGWYSVGGEQGLSEKKVRAAQKISQEYDLNMYLPPDETASRGQNNHHFEFVEKQRGEQTAAKAHPSYLVVVINPVDDVATQKLFEGLCELYLRPKFL